MKILTVDLNTDYADALREAVEILRAGWVIVYPTDTLYGLGADALSDEAFEKVCLIKGRDEKKPTHAVFANMEMAGEYAEISEVGMKLANAFLPGPLTLIFNKKPHVTTGIARDLSTIGVRIPNNEFCAALSKQFAKPYTTTSANVSGRESGSTVTEILEQLGEGARYIDLVIDSGPLSSHVGSTVVDVRDEPHVIREGAIRADAIKEWR